MKTVKSALFPVYFFISVLVSVIGLWMFFGYLMVALSDAMVKGVDKALELVRPKQVAKKGEVKKEVQVKSHLRMKSHLRRQKVKENGRKSVEVKNVEPMRFPE